MGISSMQNQYDITMQQGATFQLVLNIQNANAAAINLNSYSASMQIRHRYDSNTAVESLSTANGEITQGANTGQYVFKLIDSRTAAVYVDLKKGGFPPKTNYVYDVSLTDGQGIVSKIIWGNIEFYGQVTGQTDPAKPW